MRDIKFRNPIYSHSTGKFLYFWHFNVYPAIGISMPSMISNDEVWNKQEQFTGLKDKNGLEIYEGDIVEVDCGVTKEGNAVLEVGYEPGTFVLKALPYPWKMTAHPLEVIGNIHENPELLK